jgi:hypothetical protein
LTFRRPIPFGFDHDQPRELVQQFDFAYTARWNKAEVCTNTVSMEPQGFAFCFIPHVLKAMPNLGNEMSASQVQQVQSVSYSIDGSSRAKKCASFASTKRIHGASKADCLVLEV